MGRRESSKPKGLGDKMLVLSRKKNESIVLDNNIVLTVVEIKGDKVRIGIEAPKSVEIHRAEVFKRLYGKPDRAS